MSLLFHDLDNISMRYIPKVYEYIIKNSTIKIPVLCKSYKQSCRNISSKSQKLVDQFSIQVVDCGVYKNSTDMQMMVDVLESTIRNKNRQIIIVSSDNDFEPLVRKLTDMECQVFWFALEKSTSENVNVNKIFI